MSSLGNRACMLCGIVESSRVSCPNCVDLLDVGLSTTSPTFEGLVAIGEPDKSWVAKWLRVNTYLPGLYAVKVMGRLPQDIIETLPYYRPRDGSATD
ncbi:unnamed protein product [Wickerhamomyces anomalus]